MAKKIRFPLNMNGTDVRTIEELREHFDMDSVLGYFANGKLVTWLRDRYYDNEADAVEQLNEDDSALSAKICKAIGVDYADDESETDLEAIKLRNEKLMKLRQLTTNQNIIDSVDIVAFSQDELFDILDEDTNDVYLCGEQFSIPLGRKNVRYTGVTKPLVLLGKNTLKDYEGNGITFENVRFEGEKGIPEPEPISIYSEGERLILAGSIKEAFPIIEAAAKGGNPRAMYLMSRYYHGGYNTVLVDENERKKWCEKAVSYDYPLALYEYAANYIENDEYEQRKIYSKIFKDVSDMAATGDAFAQYVVGSMYFQKNADCYDYDKAREWYKKAAEQGYPAFFFFVTDEMILKSAEMGNVYAQVAMGKRQKNSCALDFSTGDRLYYDWVGKASDQGLVSAQIIMAEYYGRKRNKKAIKLLEMAVEKGSAEAAARLAFYIYYTDSYNLGVQNYQLAKKYFLIAKDRDPDGKFNPHDGYDMYILNCDCNINGVRGSTSFC